MEQWGPFIPYPYESPTTVPIPLSQPYVWPVPANPKIELTPEELAALLAAFRSAVSAAETFDRLTGQPDCVDPEKATPIERVEDLERRLAEIDAAGA